MGKTRTRVSRLEPDDRGSILFVRRDHGDCGSIVGGGLFQSKKSGWDILNFSETVVFRFTPMPVLVSNSQAKNAEETVEERTKNERKF